MPPVAPAPASAPVPVDAGAAPAAAPGTAGDSGALFDIAALAQTFGGKPDKMRKYTRLFLDAARDGLADIDAALAAGSLVTLAELGHKLKSSARAVGAMRFGNLCYALEQVRHDADTANAAQLVAQLHAMLPLLGPHMEQELLAYVAG